MKDLARIYVRAGNGGNGSVHFLQEKYRPKGGPDGGDGGKGGDVIMVADSNLDNLVEFNYQKKFEAESGEGGQEKKMHGNDRDDLIIRVPIGTVVYEIPREEMESSLRERPNFERVMDKRKLMVDMTQEGKPIIVAFGGKGGRGNDHFKSSTNQTPMQAEKGQEGEEKYLLLELKMVADVGIIGLPNVGKSSLLAALTRANPKIAGYPFTTLEPNLGAMKVEGKSLVLVDVPGVIEDAWEGRGIGPWFMRHLERTKMLMHVLAPDITQISSPKFSNSQIGEQLARDYKIVRKELEKYGQGLTEKKEIVVINKMELVSEEKDRVKIAKMMEKEIGKSVVWVSAGMGEVGEIVRELK